MVDLVATGIATGAPTVGTPALGIIHNLTATGIATGAPTLGTPALRAFYAVTLHPLSESTESLSWLTDVMRSPESEMRVSLRPARQALTYSYNLHDPRTAKFEGLVREGQVSEWLVPVWHEGTALASVSAAATTLAVDTNADYRAGGYLMVWGGCDDVAVVQIASVGTGSITLSYAVGKTFGQCRVMPCVFAYITQDGVGLSRIQGKGITALTVSFLSRETAPTGTTPWPQYLGLDLVKKCGTVEALAGGLVPSVALVDSQLGPVALERLRTPIDARYSMAWRMRGLDLIWARKKWLHYIRGRDRAFWLADWSADITLQAPVGASDPSILIAPVLAAPHLYVGRHIIVGDIPRAVTNAVQDGLNHRLTIAPLGSAASVDARVGFLRKVRLEADAIELAHSHGFYTAARLPLIEVPE